MKRPATRYEARVWRAPRWGWYSTVITHGSGLPMTLNAPWWRPTRRAALLVAVRWAAAQRRAEALESAAFVREV